MTQTVVNAPHLQGGKILSTYDRSIWARVAIVEPPYPVIAADDVVLSLFGNRLLLRVSSTTFTLTIYFRDVTRVVFYNEKNALEMQVMLGDGGTRAYVISCTDPGAALMLYDVLLSLLPPDVGDSALGLSSGPSFHTTDYPYSLLSPQMMKDAGFYEFHPRSCSSVPTTEKACGGEYNAASRQCFLSERQFRPHDKECCSSSVYAPSTQPIQSQTTVAPYPSASTPLSTRLEERFQEGQSHGLETLADEGLPRPQHTMHRPEKLTDVPTEGATPNTQQVEDINNPQSDSEPRLITYAVIPGDQVADSTSDLCHSMLQFCPITPASSHPSHSMTTPCALRASLNHPYSQSTLVDRPAGSLRMKPVQSSRVPGSLSTISNCPATGLLRSHHQIPFRVPNNEHVYNIQVE